MTVATGAFFYAPHSRVATFLALGWQPFWDAFRGTPHDAHAVLVWWPHEDREPVFP